MTEFSWFGSLSMLYTNLKVMTSSQLPFYLPCSTDGSKKGIQHILTTMTITEQTNAIYENFVPWFVGHHYSIAPTNSFTHKTSICLKIIKKYLMMTTTPHSSSLFDTIPQAISGIQDDLKIIIVTALKKFLSISRRPHIILILNLASI